MEGCSKHISTMSGCRPSITKDFESQGSESSPSTEPSFNTSNEKGFSDLSHPRGTFAAQSGGLYDFAILVGLKCNPRGMNNGLPFFKKRMVGGSYDKEIITTLLKVAY